MKNASYMPDEPIAAIATALAPSALAVIRVSGKNSIQLVSSIFSRPKALLNAAGYTMVHGWIIMPKNEDCSRIDEVMLGVYRAPKSFTGEDMVEIFCHGGTAPVMAVHKLLLRIGFRQAERGEFTFRAYLNGKTDLTKAEAVREIIDAKTDESRGRAAGRLSGDLYNEIEKIKQMLVHTLASIEAEVEYPEDEETIAGSFDSAELEGACHELELLNSTWSSEKLYQDGARVVLCGRTNAGKSSLFNMLLKEERAIVSDIAGTTRDWLESWISFAGIPVRLFDTAGLRQTDDLIEQSGVERSFDLAHDADLILYLVDSSTGFSEEDKGLFSELAGIVEKDVPLIIVWNKADKLNQGQTEINKISFPLKVKPSSEVFISAKTGFGLNELTKAVSAFLVGTKDTTRFQAGLGSARQKAAVDEALDSIHHALEVPSLGLSLDATVQDIEDAISFLGEITGEISPNDILENIFSRFCVGK